MSEVGRRWAAVVVGIGLVGVLSGCAGEDLSRANYQRATVTAEAGGGQGKVPEGPITDPAVGLSALRGVDVCTLLTDSVSSVGTPNEEAYALDWGKCTVDVKDAGGKVLGVSLALADTVVAVDEATGGVQGLPLIERKQDDTCSTTAVISKQPGLGITVQVSHEGESPCGPGYPLLEQILTTLHGDPPRHPDDDGSLRAVDPCPTVSAGALQSVLGESVQEASGLYACQYRSQEDRDRSAVVNLGSGFAPKPSEGRKEVDLADGVKGVQKPSTIDTATCQVEWAHRDTGGDDGEVVRVGFFDYGDEATKKQACEKAIELAKSIVPNLPSG